MTLINLLLGLSGIVALLFGIFLLVTQKKKRSDDWKVITGCLTWGIIIILAILNMIFR